MKKVIETKDLEKVYDNGYIKTPALKGIDIEIKEGEFVAIMGPSGSGKSTLLHQLGLLDKPTKGKIMIDGEEVLQFTEKQKTKYRLKKLGYVFQSYHLIPELNALENVYLTAMASGLTKEQYIKNAKKTLEEVGLGDRMDHYPAELSGGEQQRVSVARSLVNNPKILNADEPTSSLDSATSEEIIKLFRKLNKELGQTIVMVTHEYDEGKKADRIIWLKDGLLDKK